METAEQTEATHHLLHSRFTIVNNLYRTMADVCEAFSFFRVFSGLMTNIRVHSCSFVVLMKAVFPENIEIACFNNARTVANH